MNCIGGPKGTFCHACADCCRFSDLQLDTCRFIFAVYDMPLAGKGDGGKMQREPCLACTCINIAFVISQFKVQGFCIVTCCVRHKSQIIYSDGSFLDSINIAEIIYIVYYVYTMITYAGHTCGI